jgi:hypothetical protein
MIPLIVERVGIAKPKLLATRSWEMSGESYVAAVIVASEPSSAEMLPGLTQASAFSLEPALERLAAVPG